MTDKENYLEAITYGKPDHVPYVFSSVQIVGLMPNVTLDYPMGEADDGFGIHWVPSPDGPMPDNTNLALTADNITEWRDIVKIPNLDALPWDLWAQKELENADHEQKAFFHMSNNGIFDRLVALMGYTEGLSAMIEEPEAVYDLLGALADYKIDLFNHICEIYHPDVIQYVDDMATASSLFMSPDMYRELIKPHHARIIAAIQENGAIPEQHCCGKCEAIIDDFVEIGIRSWFPAQLSNDLKGIKKRYQGKLALCHGLDSQGVFSDINVSEEAIRKDVRRAIDDYAEGGGLMILPVLLGGDFQEVMMGTERRYAIIQDELKKYGKYHY